MNTQTITVFNGVGIQIRTVGGLYAVNESKDIDIVDLIVNPYKLQKLSDDVTGFGGALVVTYKNAPLSASEILLILDVISSHGQAENPPKLDMLDVNGGAAVAAAGGDISLVGRNLLRGQLFDSLTVTEGGGEQVDVFALKPGSSSFTVEVVEGVGALAVAFVAGKLTITLAAGGSSDNDIATAINADGADCEGILRAVSASAGNITLAQAEAPMLGGSGDYEGNKVMVGGLEALPQNEPGIAATAKWDDTGILCTTQAVGLAGDVVNIEVESDGLLAPPLSTVLV